MLIRGAKEKHVSGGLRQGTCSIRASRRGPSSTGFSSPSMSHVKGASLENGLLHVDLVRELPGRRSRARCRSASPPSRRWSRPMSRPKRPDTFGRGFCRKDAGRRPFCVCLRAPRWRPGPVRRPGVRRFSFCAAAAKCFAADARLKRRRPADAMCRSKSAASARYTSSLRRGLATKCQTVSGDTPADVAEADGLQGSR